MAYPFGGGVSTSHNKLLQHALLEIVLLQCNAHSTHASQFPATHLLLMVRLVQAGWPLLPAPASGQLHPCLQPSSKMALL
eukprot:765798-Pelagomonas_calceolata.AAC.6